jgi:uncharacterized membrane protein YhhN
MDKEKLKEITGFVGLGLYAVGFIAFLFYKLVYASYHYLPIHRIENFANAIMLCQSIVLELVCLSLISKLAEEKKWYNQVLIYIFALIVMYGITGCIMGVFDFLSGKPFVIL